MSKENDGFQAGIPENVPKSLKDLAVNHHFPSKNKGSSFQKYSYRNLE
jgi:hypothetical protein